MLPGHLAQRPHAGRAGQPPGRVVRQREHHGADPAARLPGRGHRPGQPVRVAHPALARRGRHEVRPDTDHGRLGRVTDPAGLRHGDVGPERQQQAEQQCLAARAADDLGGVGGSAAARPVAGRRLAQRAEPGHRAVGVPAAGRGQGVPEQRVGRQPGLAEGERQHRLAGPPLPGHGLVGGQRGGHRDPPASTRAAGRGGGLVQDGRGGAGGAAAGGGTGAAVTATGSPGRVDGMAVPAMDMALDSSIRGPARRAAPKRDRHISGVSGTRRPP